MTYYHRDLVKMNIICRKPVTMGIALKGKITCYLLVAPRLIHVFLVCSFAKKQLYDNLRTKLGASGITQSLHAIQYVLICFVFNGISLLLWNGGGTDFSFYMFVSNHRFLQTQDVFQPSVYWIHKLGLNPIRHISSLHLTGDGASSEKAPSNSTNLTTAMHPCILSN